MLNKNHVISIYLLLASILLMCVSCQSSVPYQSKFLSDAEMSEVFGGCSPMCIMSDTACSVFIIGGLCDPMFGACDGYSAFGCQNDTMACEGIILEVKCTPTSRLCTGVYTETECYWKYGMPGDECVTKSRQFPCMGTKPWCH
jgi:hypothetical protein